MVEVKTNILERFVEVLGGGKEAQAVVRGISDAAFAAAAATGIAAAVTQIGHGVVQSMDFVSIAAGDRATLGTMPKVTGIPDHSAELARAKQATGQVVGQS